MPSRWELLFHVTDESWTASVINCRTLEAVCVCARVHARTSVFATLRHTELTKLLHRLDLITTVTVAGVVLMEGSSVKLLTLHTLPKRERTRRLRRGKSKPTRFVWLGPLYTRELFHLRKQTPGAQRVKSGVQSGRTGRQRAPAPSLNFFMAHP